MSDSPTSETVSLLSTPWGDDIPIASGNPNGRDIPADHTDAASDVTENEEIATMETNASLDRVNGEGIGREQIEEDELIDMDIDMGNGQSDSDEVDEDIVNDDLCIIEEEPTSEFREHSPQGLDTCDENSPLLKDDNSSSISSKESPCSDSDNISPPTETVPSVPTQGLHSPRDRLSPKDEPDTALFVPEQNSFSTNRVEAFTQAQDLPPTNDCTAPTDDINSTPFTKSADSSEEDKDILSFIEKRLSDSSKNATDNEIDLEIAFDEPPVPDTQRKQPSPDIPTPNCPDNGDMLKEENKGTNFTPVVYQEEVFDDIPSEEDITKLSSENVDTISQTSPGDDEVPNGTGIQNGENEKSSPTEFLRNVNIEDIHLQDKTETMQDVHSSEGLENGTTPSEQNAGNDQNTSQKVERFRNKLPLWNDTTKTEVAGQKADTPIVPNLPDMDYSCHGDSNIHQATTLTHPYQGDLNDNSLQTKNSSEKSEADKTREAIASLLHEIDLFSSGDDSIFNLNDSGTNGTSPVDTSRHSGSVPSRPSVTSPSESLTSPSSDRVQVLPKKPVESQECTRQPSQVNVEDEEFNNDVMFLQENDDESTKLLPKKDFPKESSLYGSSHSSVGNGKKYSPTDHIKTDFLRPSNDSEAGIKERPKSGTSAIARFMQMFPLRKDMEKPKRPYSEEIKKSSQSSIKFSSLSDDHSKQRGLFLSPEGNYINDLLTFSHELQRHQADGGQTNEAFEGADKTDTKELEHILLNLSEQVKQIKSLSNVNGSNRDEERIHVLKSDLLESLRLLRLNLKGNEPDRDSEETDQTSHLNGENDEFTPSLGQDGVVDDARDLDNVQVNMYKLSDDDNLSLEFFLPGSKRKFRLHRQTFIVFVLKYSIFWFSFLFWFASLSGIAFGSWMLAKESAVIIDDATDVFLDPYALLIFVGGIIFIVAFFGCVGALRENICLLRIFNLSMAFVLGLEVIVGALVFLFFTLPEFRRALKVGPEEVLRQAVIYYFDDEGKRKWIDRLQKEFRCCGASLTDEGYMDWQENAYFNCSSPSVYRCSVPLSCCIFEKNDFIDYRCGADIIKREESYVKRYINTKGCMKSLGEWLGDNTSIIAYITLGVLIPQILSIIEARYFITILRRQARKSAIEEELAAEESQDEDDEVFDEDYEEFEEADESPEEASGSMKRSTISTSVL